MDYQIITTDPSLAAFCASSADAEYLALDTEFIRTRTWFPKCGLIQISNGKQTVLVDPLEITQWQPFKDLLTSPTIVKVLHSCSEDLEVFMHLLDTAPQPLFDSQFAACIAGIGTTLGYGKLVQEMLGVELDKGESRTDWLRRPLRDAQLVYAANDVVYLHKLYPLLKEKLDNLQRFDWVLMESQQLMLKKQTGLPADYRYLAIKNSWQLSTKSLAVLKELAAWRFITAIEKDSAANFVVKETALLEIAKRMPDTLSKLSALGCMTHKEIRLYGEKIISLVIDALDQDPDSYPPRIKRLMDVSAYKKVSQNIRNECIAIADKLDIPQEMMASKKQVNQFLKWRWFDIEECKLQQLQPDLLSGWRKHLLEDALKPYM